MPELVKCYINKKKQVRNKDKEGEVIKNTEESLRGMGTEWEGLNWVWITVLVKEGIRGQKWYLNNGGKYFRTEYSKTDSRHSINPRRLDKGNTCLNSS